MTLPFDESRKPLAAGLFGLAQAAARAPHQACPSEVARDFARLYASSQGEEVPHPPRLGGAGACFA